MGFGCTSPLNCVTSHLYDVSRTEAFPGGIHGTRVLTLAVGWRSALSTLVFPLKHTCAATCHRHPLGLHAASELHHMRTGVDFQEDKTFLSGNEKRD